MRQGAPSAELPETFLDQLRASRRLTPGKEEVSEMSGETLETEIKRAPIVMIPAPEREEEPQRPRRQRRRFRKIEEENTMSNPNPFAPDSIPNPFAPDSISTPSISLSAEEVKPQSITMDTLKKDIFEAYLQVKQENVRLLALTAQQGEKLRQAALWYSPEKVQEQLQELKDEFAQERQGLNEQLQAATDNSSALQARLDSAEQGLEDERQEKRRLELRNRDLEAGEASPRAIKRARRWRRFWQLCLSLLLIALFLFLAFPNLTPVRLELFHRDRRVNTVIWPGTFNFNLGQVVTVQPKGGEQPQQQQPAVTLAPTDASTSQPTATLAPTATPTPSPTATPMATAAPTFGASELLVRINGVVLNLRGWQNVACDPSSYEVVPQLQAGWTSYVIDWKQGLTFKDLVDFTLEKNR